MAPLETAITVGDVRHLEGEGGPRNFHSRGIEGKLRCNESGQVAHRLVGGEGDGVRDRNLLHQRRAVDVPGYYIHLRLRFRTSACDGAAGKLARCVARVLGSDALITRHWEHTRQLAETGRLWSGLDIIGRHASSSHIAKA